MRLASTFLRHNHRVSLTLGSDRRFIGTGLAHSQAGGAGAAPQPVRHRIEQCRTRLAGYEGAKYTSPYRHVIHTKIAYLPLEGIVERRHRDAWTPLPGRQKVSQAFLRSRSPGLEGEPRGGRPARFPPKVVVEVKALACELPRRHELPLARWSLAKVRHEVVAQVRVTRISGVMLFR